MWKGVHASMILTAHMGKSALRKVFVWIDVIVFLVHLVSHAWMECAKVLA